MPTLSMCYWWAGARSLRWCAVFAVLALLALPSHARSSVLADGPAADTADSAGLVSLGHGAVVGVDPGGILTLDDGRHVRLAGVEVVTPPPDAAPGRRWRFAEAAQQALQSWINDRPVEIWGERNEPDRHGRVVAHVRRSDGAWLQDRLLNQGLARVRPVVGDTARAGRMMVIEADARARGVGIWASRGFAVRDAEDTDTLLRGDDTLRLVEGVVRRAETRRGRLYLDFGTDWRRDFTVVATSGVARRLVPRGGDAGALVGRRVRVRGWPRWRYGPSIDVNVSEQLEFLD